MAAQQLKHPHISELDDGGLACLSTEIALTLGSGSRVAKQGFNNDKLFFTRICTVLESVSVIC